MSVGINVLFVMDVIGAALYGGNIAGVILGFTGGTEAFYFFA